MSVLTGGLPEPDQPFTWGRRVGDVIYTTHGPVTPEGTILQHGIEAQAELTLRNLAALLEKDGGTLADVVQARLFLLDVADMAPVDRVRRRHFAPPWPDRASLVVAGLVAPGMRIELTAIAHLGSAGRTE